MQPHDPPADLPPTEPDSTWFKEAVISKPPVLRLLDLDVGEPVETAAPGAGGQENPFAQIASTATASESGGLRPPLAEPQGWLARGLWGYVLPSTFFMTIAVLSAFIAPDLLHSWRITEARAEAEAAYIKRRAELRAEAEHAETMLSKFDKRVGFREVAWKVSPLVVNVANLAQPKHKELDPFGHDSTIYDPQTDRKYELVGVGSGIIVKPGFILTNHHVIKNAQRLRITFASGQSISVAAETVAGDALTDLAVIRMPADVPAGITEDMKVSADFADSDRDIQVGDWALAIGSPLGLKQTVTHGVISAKGRLLKSLMVELLQTDAAITPGNSGGPLFDQLGRVVGVNVAIASDNGRNQGIGFAIPSNTARRIFEKLASEGEVARGYLGIALEDLTGPRVKLLGASDGGGVVVTQALPNQAASKAGLRQGDVIVRVNNDPLLRGEPGRHLRQLIAEMDPGTEVSLEILRSGDRSRITVTVGRRPADLP